MLTPPLSGFGCAVAAFTESVETTYANEVTSSAEVAAASTSTEFAAATASTEFAAATAGGPTSATTTGTSANAFGGTSGTPTLANNGSLSTNSESTSLSTGAIAGIVVGGIFFLIFVVGGLAIFLIYRYKTRESRAARQRERDANKKEAERVKLETLAIKTRPSKLVLPSRNSNGPVSPQESAYGGSTVVGPAHHNHPSQDGSRPSWVPPSALNPFPTQPAAGYSGPIGPSSDTSRPPGPPPSM
ncbi:hypothetical protein OEA41_007248 [Lepraria neglecta]|uniref:Uncharacterized protein n=1 Tax=Lepraria neglecta TaxID=209136 RepID=A0AAD9ZCR8_9LECA|nr:hypothetical protein OEA41_007248 [Lepraria neglecta]